MKPLLPLLLTIVVAACASVPDELADAPPREFVPGLDEARADAEQLAGREVIWGGVIESVVNEAQASVIEIVQRPLDDSGAPDPEAVSAGRFLAVVDGFVDPTVYSRGDRVTVLGALDGVRRQEIGDYLYTYPVVRATRQYLWPEPPPRRAEPPPPYWYDPFWRPWYYHDPFWGPYPYRWRR